MYEKKLHFFDMVVYEDDNESLVAQENSTRHTSNSPLAYKVNNNNQYKFLQEDGEGIWIDHRWNEK